MLFSMILYLTSSNIESYLVIAGPLPETKRIPVLLYVRRPFTKAETGGYVNYYAREGSKINANGVVYGISSSKKTEGNDRIK